jgi:RNA polymerase sigma-70 factor (ECF subfamily)
MEIKSSENESFRLVYEEVFPVVMRVAYHVTYNMDVSEDICQEAFIRFYEKNIDFRSVDEAKYWLIRNENRENRPWSTRSRKHRKCLFGTERMR